MVYQLLGLSGEGKDCRTAAYMEVKGGLYDNLRVREQSYKERLQGRLALALAIAASSPRQLAYLSSLRRSV